MMPRNFSDPVVGLQIALREQFVDGLMGPRTLWALKQRLIPLRGRHMRPNRKFRRWYLGWHERWAVEAEIDRFLSTVKP